MRARPATADDATEVVRLAGLMFESIGLDPSEPRWQEEGRRHVRERLGADVAIFVVDHPEEEDRLVAAAAGTIAARLPVPRDPTGRAGYVQWVCTEPGFRRKGLGRQVMDALLGWYDSEGVLNVELHATPDGEALYRSLGFSDGAGGLPLRRQTWLLG